MALATDRELAHALGQSSKTYTRWATAAEADAVTNVYDVTARQFKQASGSDRTDALRFARDAAVKTGGEIFFPPGQHVLTRAPGPFMNSGALGERAVYVRGPGWGSTMITWKPLAKHQSDNVLVWGAAEDSYHYVGGGASGFSLFSATDDASGCALWSRRTIFQRFRDVWVRRFYKGTGMQISPPPGQDQHNPQHIRIDNVQLQQCKQGLYARYGADVVATQLMLNQNLTAGTIEFGSFAWRGGLLQGVNTGPALYIGKGSYTSHVIIDGVHIENNTNVAIDVDFSTHVEVRNPNWGHRAGQILIDARHSALVDVGGTGAAPGAFLVRGRSGARGVIRNCRSDGSDIDVDASCAFVLEPDGALGPPLPGVLRWR